MWLGFSVCLSCLSPHDLPEKAGKASLAISRLPQFPDSAGRGQPPGSVLLITGIQCLGLITIALYFLNGIQPVRFL